MRGNGSRRAAFTLIELMVVIALVGVLMAGVLRMVGAAGESSKRATTVQRLQRLENAIAGYYAEYGTYPPVQNYDFDDPRTFYDDKGSGVSAKISAQTYNNCIRAARAQPVAFEFPTRKGFDAHLNQFFAVRGDNVISANQNASSFKATRPSDISNDNLWKGDKLFKFGLMSFLLPRLMIIGVFDTNGNISQKNNAPDEVFFDHWQWTTFNNSKRNNYKAQLRTEANACARWLPNLERMLHGGPEVMGIRTGTDEMRYYVARSSGGQTFGLQRITVNDGWGNEFFYYSAPPYQSYRLWSSGPDGRTFPREYPLEKLAKDERKIAAGWMKDDITGFDR